MAHKKKDLFEYYVGKYIAGIPPDIFKSVLRGEHNILDVKSDHGILILTLKDNCNSHNNYYAKKAGTKIDCICRYYYSDNLNFDKTELRNILKNPARYYRQIIERAFNANYCISCAHCHETALVAYDGGELFLKSERDTNFNDSQE